MKDEAEGDAFGDMIETLKRGMLFAILLFF